MPRCTGAPGVVAVGVVKLPSDFLQEPGTAVLHPLESKIDLLKKEASLPGYILPNADKLCHALQGPGEVILQMMRRSAPRRRPTRGSFSSPQPLRPQTPSSSNGTMPSTMGSPVANVGANAGSGAGASAGADANSQQIKQQLSLPMELDSDSESGKKLMLAVSTFAAAMEKHLQVLVNTSLVVKQEQIAKDREKRQVINPLLGEQLASRTDRGHGQILPKQSPSQKGRRSSNTFSVSYGAFFTRERSETINSESSDLAYPSSVSSVNSYPSIENVSSLRRQPQTGI